MRFMSWAMTGGHRGADPLFCGFDSGILIWFRVSSYGFGSPHMSSGLLIWLGSGNYCCCFKNCLNIHGPFFGRIWLKLSGIARNSQSRIPLFYFFEKNFLLSYLSFTFFQGFCRINKTILFFNGFSYFFILSFCCCPAGLQSVEIFEISLSVLELCQQYFFLFFENNS